MPSDQTAKSIPHLLATAAQKRPHAVAYCQRTAEGRWLPITWSELWREVRQRAKAFRRLGLGAGDRLAILARTCPAWQIAEMAGLLAGAAIVGIEPHAPEDQIAFILDRAKVNALVVDSAANLAKVPHALRARLKFVVPLDDGVEAGAPNLVSWRDMTAGVEGGDWDEDFPSADNPAALLFTAGTTGTPKGILYTHAQILAGCRAIHATFSELGEDDSTLCWLPMAHLFQRMINLAAMSCGMKIFFVEDPRDILPRIQETRPSVFVAVPRFFEKLHEGIQQRLAKQSEWHKWLIDAALAAGAEYARCTAASLNSTAQ